MFKHLRVVALAGIAASLAVGLTAGLASQPGGSHSQLVHTAVLSAGSPSGGIDWP